MEQTSSNVVLTLEPIPETTIYLFKQIHTKDAAFIKINKDKQFFFSKTQTTLKLAKELFGVKSEKDGIEVRYIDRLYYSFWAVNAEREIFYNKKRTYNIPLENADAKQIIFYNDEFKSNTLSVNNKTIELNALEICHRKNDYITLFDNNTGYSDDSLQSLYIDNPEYGCNKKAKDVEPSKLIKPKLNKESLIEKVISYLYSDPVSNDEIVSNTIKFNKIDLYLVPIYIFECYEKSTEKRITVKFNAVTGKILKDNFTIDTIKNEQFAELLREITSETLNAMLPGAGAVFKYITNPQPK